MVTKRDPVLSQVCRFLQNGWSSNLPSEFQPFITKKDELLMVDNCLLWGSCLVIPPTGRKLLLEELHEAHTGISHMKSRARMLMWWLNIDKDIKNMVRSCSACQASRPLPHPAPLQPWSWPGKPWSWLHLDYAGPMKNKMFLVVIDAYSK